MGNPYIFDLVILVSIVLAFFMFGRFLFSVYLTLKKKQIKVTITRKNGEVDSFLLDLRLKDALRKKQGG